LEVNTEEAECIFAALGELDSEENTSRGVRTIEEEAEDQETSL